MIRKFYDTDDGLTSSPASGKESTALQDVINACRETNIIGQSEYAKGYYAALEDIELLAISLLPKEEMIIVEAFRKGYSNGNIDTAKTGEEYFTQTFKQ